MEHPLIIKTDWVFVTEEMLLIRLARLIMVVLNSLTPVRITEDLSRETALKGACAVGRTSYPRVEIILRIKSSGKGMQDFF